MENEEDIEKLSEENIKKLSIEYNLLPDIIKSLDSKNFSCQKCSNCCRNEPGIVKLTNEDYENIKNHLKMDDKTFLSQCCREIYKNGKVYVGLKEKKNFDCIFWSNGCIIYEVRPLQCKTFPYWPSLVESDIEWKEEKNRCKGLDIKTDLTTDLTIEEKINFYLLEKNAKYKTWEKE